ncbi:hypothetical protein BAZ12_03725 [Elizabethkingia miricola]|uniref:Uncharacterized protein n=2 Tax=Elizabethkingia miricola TaxID=172045 RepID=A0AAQ1PFC1_ELIMR|nr:MULTISPECIES: hypothetical protein [Elizabethkingia]KUY19861.1 hypothetical protein ATB95_02705 [Elizabethkingia miricola]MCL1651507.1 hypothetical protein [Elizabethkingia miricola]OPC14153.1 hypothetical protein BAY01_07065 [Elizabethkingia miricola]OPC32410.1 hypothetical protein BAX99_09245 [Elizabethkingia miricola]OPC72913.1 hypothetical protein BAZ12_03725 [Elizabethkingia miricola]
MKSSQEILEMLTHELTIKLNNIEFKNSLSKYYNDTLGDSSFLLAGLLESILKANYEEWSNMNKWIDDSLIMSINTQNERLTIQGIMILGEIDTTQQWIAPFLFSVELFQSKINSKKFTFLFSDSDSYDITYEEFNNHNYQINSDIEWKYIINSNDILI